MSTIVTVVNHIFSLDIAWLFNFALDNILWVFLFAAAAVFFYKEKNWFWATVYITFYVWAAVEFTDVVGWVVFDKMFLLVTMLAAVAVLAFAEFDSWGSKNLLLINTVRFLVVLVGYNLFFG
ncbi:hypothetical protein KKE06_00795 [Candidatus Micrarchaeota archaeon]|nr:hypothetical protein [Candidatus Micrarchaeota archaeon]MBU1930144.1 hypothetical protein [Candidatus Micrarchaeota archaeon]